MTPTAQSNGGQYDSDPNYFLIYNDYFQSLVPTAISIPIGHIVARVNVINALHYWADAQRQQVWGSNFTVNPKLEGRRVVIFDVENVMIGGYHTSIRLMGLAAGKNTLITKLNFWRNFIPYPSTVASEISGTPGSVTPPGFEDSATVLSSVTGNQPRLLQQLAYRMRNRNAGQ